MIKKLMTISVAVLLIGLAGCATQVTEKPTKTKRASINLSDFKQVVLVATEIAPTYADNGANIKAVNKIDELLNLRVSELFEDVAVVELDEVDKRTLAAAEKGDTLLIKPYVKQIKFIGGAARFWGGAMAGSSVVIIDAVFVDAATGEVIGKTGTYRKAGAYSDPFGIGSNRMLDDAAQDIINYIASNQ